MQRPLTSFWGPITQPLGDAFVTLTLPHPPRNETTMNLWSASSLGSPLHTYQGYSDAIKDFGFRVGVDMRGISWAGRGVAVICISACITHGFTWQVVGGNSQLNVSVHNAWTSFFLKVLGGGLQFRVFCHASLFECGCVWALLSLSARATLAGEMGMQLITWTKDHVLRLTTMDKVHVSCCHARICVIAAAF
jgi:hypothetical protein